MEVNPTVVAVLGVLALSLARLTAVEDFVERLTMNIAQHDIQILAKRHIPIGVNNETAYDALTSQSQVAIAPLIIKSHEVEVFLGLTYARRNLIYII